MNQKRFIAAAALCPVDKSRLADECISLRFKATRRRLGDDTGIPLVRFDLAESLAIVISRRRLGLQKSR
jgi:hypothetical protein